MSAKPPAKLPMWIYDLLHYPDGATQAKTPNEALETALAVQRIALLMAHGMKAEEEDGDGELLEHVSLCGWLWTRRASELLAAERAAALPQPQPEKAPDLKRSVARRKAVA